MTLAAKPELAPGRVYRTRDLGRWSANPPRLAKRLVRSGELVPLAHGLFAHPKRGRFGTVPPGDEEMLDRCSMILRLAEHLERGRDQSVSEARLQTNGDGMALHLHADGDLTLPRWSVERYGDDEAFRRVFHRPLVIG